VTLPRLYAIVDFDVCRRAAWTPSDLTRAYLSGGVRLLQIRAKAEASGALLDATSQIVEDARKAGAQVIVNDRADLAVLADAAGIHVGQEDLTPSDVRRIAGPSVIVGLSTHTADQIARALEEPISYLAIGPVFTTDTKATGFDAVGHTAVRQAAARAARHQLPVVAIGGITLATAPGVIEAGAAAVAIISDLVTADPEARVRQYLSALA
jgi:thiamine-phosphate pyrophosphorylase